MNYSSVKVYQERQFVSVKITSNEKPKISKIVIEKWQNILDLISLSINVPSALIMNLEKKYFKVFLKNESLNNPYHVGEKAELHSGLYCETVVGTKSYLLVPNALNDPYWKNNPDVALNMISYLGFPIIWPDDEVFGTLCILDNKENHYTEQNIKLMKLLKDSIEKDLQLLINEKALKNEIKNRTIIEDKLEKSEAMYKELFNNMRSAVMIMNVQDKGKTFIFDNLNKAAEKIEKISKDDVLGKSILDIFPELPKHGLIDVMKEVWETGIPHNFGTILYEDARIKGWRDNYFIYKLSSEQIAIIYDDVSKGIEQQKIIQEKELIIHETLELEKLKSEFFSNMSHEFKTPLNVIFCTIQVNEMLLKNQNKTLDKNKLLNNINTEKANCFRLLRLFNNLIDSTKLNTNDFKANMVKCNIVSFIEKITDSVSVFIQNCGLSLTFDTNIEEKIIACDKDKIERIMLNLLSNSIKYTNPGGKILVKFIDGNKFIKINVEDTGMGIPEDKLTVIFNRFKQVDTSFTRENEGSGLGLYLVKSFVEMHGGTISVESKQGIGAKFIITLPVKTEAIESSNQRALFEDNAIDDFVEKIKIEFSDIYKLHNV